MEEFLLPCLNKQLFGIDCLGCGGQRALMLLFEGEFSAAFAMYPAIYSLLLLLFFIILNFFFKFKKAMIIKTALIIANAAIIILSYYFKMEAYF